MYFVKIENDIAVLLLRSDHQQMDEGFYEISEEQFDACVIPCRAEVTEEGVTLGEAVSLDEIPQNGEPCEPEPKPDPEPTAEEILNAMLGVTE